MKPLKSVFEVFSKDCLFCMYFGVMHAVTTLRGPLPACRSLGPSIVRRNLCSSHIPAALKDVDDATISD
jgi:hypothetical protein